MDFNCCLDITLFNCTSLVIMKNVLSPEEKKNGNLQLYHQLDNVKSFHCHCGCTYSFWTFSLLIIHYNLQHNRIRMNQLKSYGYYGNFNIEIKKRCMETMDADSIFQLATSKSFDNVNVLRIHCNMTLYSNKQTNQSIVK